MKHDEWNLCTKYEKNIEFDFMVHKYADFDHYSKLKYVNGKHFIKNIALLFNHLVCFLRK